MAAPEPVAWYITISTIGEFDGTFQRHDIHRFRVNEPAEDYMKQSASYTCLGIHTSAFNNEAHPQVSEFAADLIYDGEGRTPALRQAQLLPVADLIPFGSVHVSIHYFKE